LGVLQTRQSRYSRRLKNNNMKVIFVASGNKKYGVSSFVAAQAKSLQEAGVDVVMFPVVGKGWKGYFSNISKLRKLIKEENPDLIHAHYSTCGVLAFLATRKPIVTSILGSFPNPNSGKAKWVRFFVKHVWKQNIVKSQRTANQLGIEGVHIVPSGVNLEQFKPYDFKESRKQLGFSDDKKYVIFVSNPARPEKNFALAENAVKVLNDENVELIPVFDKPHDEVVRYMSAADALVLTSKNEGSPNVIKEAMACNCPIVTTDVGDVTERLIGLDGCYVVEGNPHCVDTNLLCERLSLGLKTVLEFWGRTKGRKKIIEDGITTEQIAEKIKTIYKAVLC